MTDYLMCIVFGCVVVTGGICRFRRDLGGPPLAFGTHVLWWASLGVLMLWVGMDWVTDAHDRWFTTMTGAVPLASVEVVCLVLVLVDTVAGSRRRRGRHRAE